jgi:hypothetical protein
VIDAERARIVQAAQKAAAEAPPLSGEQRARLRVLLLGGKARAA